MFHFLFVYFPLEMKIIAVLFSVGEAKNGYYLHRVVIL